MDVFTPEQRSAVMRQVKSKDTAPEKLVRSIVHRLGRRFRLHGADLPGKPDLVFPRSNQVIFVHGCFWHGHDCPAGLNRPRSNSEYWTAKLDRNARRDRRNQTELRRLGWRVMVVWECETRDPERLAKRLSRFLS